MEKHNTLYRQSRWLLLVLLPALLLGSVVALTRSGAAQAPFATRSDCVPGPHSGTITADERWCLADSPHLMSADVTVAAGVTITIEPGVTVKAGTVATHLIVRGHLEAIGTQTQPIVLTSLADSGPGQWPGITFDGGTGLLGHTTVRYAGRRIYTCPGGVNSAAISVVNVQTGTVTLADSQVLDSAYYDNSDHGLCIKNSRVVVSNTLFSGIGDNASQLEYPIYIGGPTSDVSLSGLRLENNVYNRVGLVEGALTGHDFTLTAQPVMDGYEFHNGADGADFVVPAGITMTVEPGVTLFNNWDINLTLVVRGHLQAVGTEAEPIVFTSHADSGPYQWKGLTFEGGTGLLRHTIVRYAGRGCYGCSTYDGAGILARNVQAVEVRIEASQVMSITGSTSMTNQGLRVENSRVVVSNTTFSGIGDSAAQLDYPIYISGATSEASLSGLRLERNQHDRVLLDLGALTGRDFTLTRQPVMEGYEFYRGTAGSNFIVPAGITMTVEPGVTLFNNWDINLTLVVRGHLQAVGTEAEPIVFTSHADSGPYQWKGLTFEGGTGNLRHTIVRYAGRGSYGGPGGGSGITVANAQTGTVTIAASQVRDISGGASTPNYGLTVLNSRVVVSDTRFTNISDAVGVSPAAIWVKDNSTLALSGSALDGNNRNGLLIEGAARVHIDRTAIVGNGDHGVVLNGNTAVFTMTNSTVLANIKDGVRNSGNAQVTLGGAQKLSNAILNNGAFGANQIGTGAQMLATYNWWGDLTGPYHATHNPGGLGNKVSDRVLFHPWATEWRGEPYNGELRVWMHGPGQVSPGYTGIYALSYYNLMTETVESAVLVFTLPTSGAYRSSTGGGIYWGARQQVYWLLGDLEPMDSGVVTVRVRYHWGIPQRTLERAMVALGGASLAESPVKVADYLEHAPRIIVQTTRLTAAQFEQERQALPELETLYQRASAGGFVDVTVNSLGLNTGEVITQAVLLKPDLGAAMYLTRQADHAEAVRVDRTSIAIMHATGGITMNLQTGTYDAWGDLTPALRSLQANAPGPIGAQNCLKNCLIMDVGSAVLGEFVKAFGALSTISNCVNFMATGNAVAAEQCITGALPGASIAAELINCFMKYMGDPNSCQCTAEKWEPAKLWGIEQCRKIPCINGVYRPDQESYYFCPFGQKCIPGINGSPYSWDHCQGCPKPTPRGCQESAAANQALACGASGDSNLEDCEPTCVYTPSDPNAKVGLAGDLLPGQLVTYTIAYENVGAGEAYSVYVTDRLSEHFDATTLTLYGEGWYIANTRTIIWTVGDLGPQGTPEAHGVVSFTVHLKDDLPSGTTILNQAFVYFPTVPEETPTNLVLNVIQPIAAIPQQVETQYMQPVTIPLQGREASGAPLTFAIADLPVYGELRLIGATAIYTPSANFVGVDTFTFSASNGTTQSQPAEVQITVSPTGDTTPPTITWTEPVNGALNVPVISRVVLTDALGAIYRPFPIIQFSEALNAVTITAPGAVQMVDASGAQIPISVNYDGVMRQASIQLRQPLQPERWYTITVASGVQDVAGNALAQDTSWRFRTAQDAIRLYLPLLLKQP